MTTVRIQSKTYEGYMLKEKVNLTDFLQTDILRKIRNEIQSRSISHRIKRIPLSYKLNKYVLLFLLLKTVKNPVCYTYNKTQS